MLSFEAVGWSVGGTRILGAVDLTVGPGELVVLLGPSGVGKSTVLRLAAGLIAPETGRIDNAAASTAMVFQEPRLLPWESALDNVGLPLAAAGIGRRAAREEARRRLTRLGFGAADAAKRPAQLSGGMAARVAIARAFVAAPELVLLDEPFAALDLARRRDLQGLLRDLVDETGVGALFVTHDLGEAVRLADRILVLSGRPAAVTSVIAHRPIADPAAVWQAAADLARRPEIVAPFSAGAGGPPATATPSVDG
jgi:NitT/TauT family transport system ATP-binding protein